MTIYPNALEKRKWAFDPLPSINPLEVVSATVYRVARRLSTEIVFHRQAFYLQKMMMDAALSLHSDRFFKHDTKEEEGYKEFLQHEDHEDHEEKRRSQRLFQKKQMDKFC